MTIRACHLLGAPRCSARRTSITFVTRITPPYTRVSRWLRVLTSLPLRPSILFHLAPTCVRMYACDAWSDQGGREERGGWERWWIVGCPCPLYRSRGKEWPTVRLRKRPLYVTYVAFVKGPVVQLPRRGRVLWDTRQWASADDIPLPPSLSPAFVRSIILHRVN